MQTIFLMKKEALILKGFAEMPHLVLGSFFTLDVGRDRFISVGSIGTPSEVVFLNQRNKHNGISDLICVHNWDYDGPLNPEKLDLIISVFA